LGNPAVVKTNSDLRTIEVVPAEALDWLPPEGHYGRIPMRNTLASQEPETPSDAPKGHRYGRGFRGILVEYTGAVFADAYSELGAIVLHGGGHAAWWGNDVHVGDLTTLTWRRILDPSPQTLAPNYKAAIRKPKNSLNQYLADRTPCIVHTYACPQYMPPSWGASGPLGAYMKLTADAHSRRVFAEKVDLADPSWDPITPESEAGTHVGVAFYPMTARDDRRQCFYVAQGRGQGTNHYWTIDKDGSVTKNPGWMGTTETTVACMSYCPPLDLIVAMSSKDSPDTVSLRKPGAAGSAYKPGTTGERITINDRNGAHPEWDPDRGCFVFWDPRDLKIYKLHPPQGDPLTQPWKWTSEAIAAWDAHPVDTPPGESPGGMWSKLRRVPALKAFVYPASMTELQIIRPSGA
jgi:hypothetical protein